MAYQFQYKPPVAPSQRGRQYAQLPVYRYQTFDRETATYNFHPIVPPERIIFSDRHSNPPSKPGSAANSRASSVRALSPVNVQGLPDFSAPPSPELAREEATEFQSTQPLDDTIPEEPAEEVATSSPPPATVQESLDPAAELQEIASKNEGVSSDNTASSAPAAKTHTSDPALTSKKKIKSPKKKNKEPEKKAKEPEKKAKEPDKKGKKKKASSKSAAPTSTTAAESNPTALTETPPANVEEAASAAVEQHAAEEDGAPDESLVAPVDAPADAPAEPSVEEPVSTSSETPPTEAPPAEAPPTEAPPAEAPAEAPAEEPSSEAVPAEAPPAEVPPAEPSPAEAVPEEAAPEKAAPAEAAPEEAAPAEAQPAEPSPIEMPEEAIPAEEAPVESPVESSNVEASPKEPVETHTESATEVKSSGQEETPLPVSQQIPIAADSTEAVASSEEPVANDQPEPTVIESKMESLPSMVAPEDTLAESADSENAGGIATESNPEDATASAVVTSDEVSGEPASAPDETIVEEQVMEVINTDKEVTELTPLQTIEHEDEEFNDAAEALSDEPIKDVDSVPGASDTQESAPVAAATNVTTVDETAVTTEIPAAENPADNASEETVETLETSTETTLHEAIEKAEAMVQTVGAGVSSGSPDVLEGSLQSESANEDIMNSQEEPAPVAGENPPQDANSAAPDAPAADQVADSNPEHQASAPTDDVSEVTAASAAIAPAIDLQEKISTPAMAEPEVTTAKEDTHTAIDQPATISLPTEKSQNCQTTELPDSGSASAEPTLEATSPAEAVEAPEEIPAQTSAAQDPVPEASASQDPAANVGAAGGTVDGVDVSEITSAHAVTEKTAALPVVLEDQALVSTNENSAVEALKAADEAPAAEPESAGSADVVSEEPTVLEAPTTGESPVAAETVVEAIHPTEVPSTDQSIPDDPPAKATIEGEGDIEAAPPASLPETLPAEDVNPDNRATSEEIHAEAAANEADAVNTIPAITAAESITEAPTEAPSTEETLVENDLPVVEPETVESKAQEASPAGEIPTVAARMSSGKEKQRRHRRRREEEPVTSTSPNTQRGHMKRHREDAAPLNSALAHSIDQAKRERELRHATPEYQEKVRRRREDQERKAEEEREERRQERERRHREEGWRDRLRREVERLTEEKRAQLKREEDEARAARKAAAEERARRQKEEDELTEERLKEEAERIAEERVRRERRRRRRRDSNSASSENDSAQGSSNGSNAVRPRLKVNGASYVGAGGPLLMINMRKAGGLEAEPKNEERKHTHHHHRRQHHVDEEGPQRHSHHRPKPKEKEKEKENAAPIARIARRLGLGL